jgi:hypothetical protein
MRKPLVRKRPRNRPRYRKEFVALFDWPVRTEEDAKALARKLKADKSRAGMEPPMIVKWDKRAFRYLVVAYCKARPAPDPPPRPRLLNRKLTPKKRK